MIAQRERVPQGLRSFKLFHCADNPFTRPHSTGRRTGADGADKSSMTAATLLLRGASLWQLECI